MPKISVIVAVYQAGKYLQKCLDSIRSQTFSDFEVVLVDDGSKDTSGQICDEYASIDSRFKVIHKENGGVASARQLGLELSEGDYVIHVDPDDWIDSEMLGKMYRNAVEKKSDMVICDFMKHVNGRCFEFSQNPGSLEHQIVMQNFFGSLHGSCCNKLIKRCLFDKFDINFPQNMNVWEDLFVCIKLTMHDIRVSYIPEPLYHYMCSANENSIVASISRRKLDSMLSFIEYFDKLDGFDKSLLIRRKIEAKRMAFLLKKMKRKEFYEICPDINDLYYAKFSGFRKLDHLIRFSLFCSWPISRLCFSLWKIESLLLRK
ncbi:glycosyltransferase family 2 protein [Fibrobacter sp. UWB10]|uniref:glycosyltransferase family 2 protein n=1 Tax=Fibrobacter sp. UWB10 TaxID=1896201 RepID=UPI0024036BD5|nr:glycosyltransferase family 2 protein [Fibrobacter sp. UWB10]SMP47321.1 Glycosyltransferase involved in cell wall bisynthesis [Fibrobacter sp. UWB10]